MDYPWHPTELDKVPDVADRVKAAVWKKYRKTAVQEMRGYISGEDLTGVSVAPGETPKEGGKIARDDQGNQWYVSPEFMADSYELDDGVTPTRAQKFVRHIAGHLSKGQYVCCKICGKRIDEIANNSLHGTLTNQTKGNRKP